MIALPGLSPRDESVKRAIKGGSTMSEAAGRLGLSRNQIAGIIDRLRRKGHLPAPTTRQKSGGSAGLAARIKAEKRRQEKEAKKSEKLRVEKLRKAEKSPSSNDRTAQPAPTSTPFLGLSAFHPLSGVEPVPFGSPGCKFPVDGVTGKGLLWCGATREPGDVYCPTHCRVAYTPAKIRKAA